MHRSLRRLASLAFFLAGVLAVPGSGQQGGFHYERKDSWIETMHATRDAWRASHRENDYALGSWYATAPLPAKKFGLALFPEEGIDLAATDEEGKPLWTEHPEWGDGTVHALPLLNHAHTYLARTITVSAATTLATSFGSDDGLQVWLNGESVLKKNVARGPAANQDRLDLALDAGENQLLLKIHNQTGHHAFYFSVGANPVAAVWNRLAADFPVEAGWMTRDLPGGAHLAWFDEGQDLAVSRKLVNSLARALGVREGHLAEKLATLPVHDSGAEKPPGWLDLYRDLCWIRERLAALDAFDFEALRRSIEHLSSTFPDTYAPGRDLVAEFDELVTRFSPAGLHVALVQGTETEVGPALGAMDTLVEFRREALLANPLLEDFERILAVKRPASSPKIGLPQNWQGNCSLPRSGYDDEIVIFDVKDGYDHQASEREPWLDTVFAPASPRMIADVDLHFDADRMLFSMPDDEARWQIWELNADGTNLRQVTTSEHPAIDNYDACYLPNERIIFGSTRVFQGVPCVGGADAVANLFLLDEKEDTLRQLCFDQDHDWCPVVLNNGRVMYQRWEYSDTPHYFSRLIFHMNPDGTGQTEYYGSNSFWPNSLFYTRPIPDHPTKFVGIVGGHHGVPRMGELVVFDPGKGRFEADGVVQRIPGFGEEVEPVIVDQLVNASWPKFLHPYPLSDKYFLVSAQPTAADSWGIYLVDVFDNMTLLAELPGYALLEPIPFRPTERPPVIPDRVDLERDDATIYLTDVHSGPGLEGVPQGTVKKLRVYEFHYAYPNMGGHKHVAVEGAWDVHRILGTVPVEEDGSAAFTVPANTPLAIQPLDEDGCAVQLMRSWFTAMPGETLSCVGCHEPQNSTPAVRPTIAGRKAPRDIEPWYGPTRGFSFKREVQPVLDRSCAGCHDGRADEQGRPMPDLRRKAENGWGNFTPAYLALHPYVRRPGPESDYHLQKPLEYHARTSELVQLLEKGHYGVELDEESWDRLVTWIDLNVPDHGTWTEHRAIAADYQTARQEMRSCYANVSYDAEADFTSELEDRVVVAPVIPQLPPPPPPGDTEIRGWPLSTDEAEHRLTSRGDLPAEVSIDLGGGEALKLVYVPSGHFLLGDLDGFADERPRAEVDVTAFYLGAFEVTRGQYARFDPTHHNGYHDQHHKDHTTPGYPANEADKPVIRVTWHEAMAFCAWLSKRTGLECTLPTEAEWEWACRAGSATPFAYGGFDADFGSHANLADASMRLHAVSGVNPQPIANPSPFEDFLPRDGRFDDGEKVMARVGKYQANTWGLFDMHGNVGEWTRSKYVPYPYHADDGRNAVDGGEDRVVRGGSWGTRPRFARAAHRLPYRPYQPVHDVGFRVRISDKGFGRIGR